MACRFPRFARRPLSFHVRHKGAQVDGGFSGEHGLVRLAYPDKEYFGTAIELIDRCESFIAVVDGNRAKRIYAGAKVYADYLDRYVGLFKPKDRRILWKLFWVALPDILFWSSCVYSERRRNGIVFTFNSEKLEVLFGFGSEQADSNLVILADNG